MHRSLAQGCLWLHLQALVITQKGAKGAISFPFLTQELEPKAALQQISLPVESDQRAAGLASLSQLVWSADSRKLGMPREDFMRAVRDQLTAAEQVGLYVTYNTGLCQEPHVEHRCTGRRDAGTCQGF